jgi:peptide/nickel transport system substrate-binding protein
MGAMSKRSDGTKRHRLGGLLAVGALVTTATVLAVEAGPTGAGAAGGKNRLSASSALVVNDPVGPATLDEAGNACGNEDQWAANFYRQLVEFGSKRGPYPGTTVENSDKIIGDVAKSWTESSDGKRYVFHLNPTAKFLDGKPINAAAVKFTFQRAVKLASCGGTFWVAENFKNIPTVATPNNTTVVFHFKKPNQLFLSAIAATGPASIYEPSEVLKHPDKKGQSVNPYWATHIAGGGGPFILDSYSPDHLMTMHRNPSYNGPRKAKSEKVVVNFGMAESTAVLQARSGAADVTEGITPDDMASLAGSGQLRVLKFAAPLMYSLGMNNSLAPFDNQTFREALLYAIPYKDILTQVMRGFGELYYGPITHALPHFNPKLSAPVPLDLTKAQALLKQSGVATPVNVQLVLQEGATVPAAMATIIQASWKQIGVNVTLRTLGVTDYNTTVEAHKAQVFIRIDGPGDPDPGWLLGYDMVCGGPFNLSVICIPEADKLLAAAESTSNQAKQQQAYDKITTVWRSHWAKGILLNIDNGIVLNKRVKHFEWGVNPQQLYNIWK